MASFPVDYEESWTLGHVITKEGIGLHFGNTSKVKLMPTDIPGFHISFRENPNEIITIKIEHVTNSPLCTTLNLGNKSLSTVEHLLSALIGSGLTHVHIEVLGNEIPLLDGSALYWVKAIQEVGLVKLKTPKKNKLKIKKPILVSQGDSFITAIPSEKLKIIGIIDFPYKAIGQQIFSVDLNPKTFSTEIAPARTFGFLDQIEHLKQKGLIKGGNLNNALVCDGDGWLNAPLRFDNEPVRHKMLDLIGDLAPIGLPKAQILVYRGSHSLHAEFAAALQKQFI